MTDSQFNSTQFIASSILIFIYLSLFVFERIWPLRKQTQSLLNRIFINGSLTILVYVVAILIISPVAAFTLNQTASYRFGILPLLYPDKPASFVLGFLLMDLTFYYWHRLNHVTPLLWRFHNVHHVDPELDVTTSMRFHFVEIAYSSIFRLVQLGLIGINPITFFCYEFAFQANTFFQHSNLKLPIRLERLLNLIIVTPRMHGIHHSDYQDETNRNYGVVFSFWDRLHRTIKLNIPQQSITIGVAGYLKPTDNKLLNLLLMPMRAQRNYWLTRNENHLSRNTGTSIINDSQLSE